VLIEGRKGGHGGLEVEPPLLLYEGREYTPEVMAMYRGEGGGS
jgi:tRNA1(Val) A37 N6-methylase TrmN6